MEIRGLDHCVLTVEDVDRSCDFYRRVLGFEIVTFAGNRKALLVGSQKINLHQSGSEIEPCARNPLPGSADLCFIADSPLSIIVEELSSAGVEVERGPVPRTGAQGPITSIYFRDPDGNLIELGVYPVDKP